MNELTTEKLQLAMVMIWPRPRIALCSVCKTYRDIRNMDRNHACLECRTKMYNQMRMAQKGKS